MRRKSVKTNKKGTIIGRYSYKRKAIAYKKVIQLLYEDGQKKSSFDSKFGLEMELDQNSRAECDSNSDQGSQYKFKKFLDFCNKYQVIQSMSRADAPTIMPPWSDLLIW